MFIHNRTESRTRSLAIRRVVSGSTRRRKFLIILAGIACYVVWELCKTFRAFLPKQYRSFYYAYIAERPTCDSPNGTTLTHRVPIYRTSLLNLAKVRVVNTEVPVNSMTEAICEFNVRGKRSAHFPHAMQQLYQCWSFWNLPEHMTKKRVLMIPKHAAGFDGERLSIVDKAKRFPTNHVGHDFQTGLLAALTEACNVTVIRGYEGTAYDSSQSVRVTNEDSIFRMKSTNDSRLIFKALNDRYKLIDGSSDRCRGNIGGQDEPIPRIAILNRELSASRSLINIDEIVESLQSYIVPSTTHISLATFESASFLDQVKFFANNDIVISPHGAQLTLLPFLPACGRILEVLPANFYFNKYFGSLADVSGLDMYTLYLSDQVPTDVEKMTSIERARYRNVFLCPPVDDVVNAVQQMVDDWLICCSNGNTTV